MTNPGPTPEDAQRFTEWAKKHGFMKDRLMTEREMDLLADLMTANLEGFNLGCGRMRQVDQDIYREFFANASVHIESYMDDPIAAVIDLYKQINELGNALGVPEPNSQEPAE